MADFRINSSAFWHVKSGTCAAPLRSGDIAFASERQAAGSTDADAVYLSQGQLLPYEPVRETFADQLGLPLSAGTLANFNREAFKRLASLGQALKPLLADQCILHVDETGINIDGQRRWLHTAGNPYLTHYAAHAKRGQEAMNDLGILPYFTGVLCHDHSKPYYRTTACQRALCNAHHLRALERVAEDSQAWAKTMQTRLLDLHQATEAAGGMLAPDDAKVWRTRYRQVIADAECPAPVAPTSGPRRKGRLKRNLVACLGHARQVTRAAARNLSPDRRQRTRQLDVLKNLAPPDPLSLNTSSTHVMGQYQVSKRRESPCTTSQRARFYSKG